MQFKLKIVPEYYNEIILPTNRENRSKEHEEIIGNVRVSYLFYANGTVMVFTESSNNPFKLEDEIDLSRLIAFFGQIRDRLVIFLNDKHERIVQDIMEWRLTQCDINKDIQVSDALHFTGIKIQVKHLDHLFRIYVKSMGKDTVCRIEESVYPKQKSAIEIISDLLNPAQPVEKNNDVEILPTANITNSSIKDEESPARSINDILAQDAQTRRLS